MNQPLSKMNFLVGVFAFTITACEKSPQSIAENPQESTYLWEDATEKYLPKTAEWTNRVEVADINGDNRVDLIFANGGDYSEPGALESSRVFLNQGPDAQFLEVTEEIFGEEKSYARVIKVRDLNGDGNPDILVGNTFQTQSELYLGLGKGKFERVTETHLPALLASVGDIEFGDADDDGDLDIIFADWGPGSNMENSGGRTRLWLNDGSGVFTDVTETQMPDILIQFSWDLEFFDFDNDFDLDIAVSCKQCGSSRLFVNDGKGNFTNKHLLPTYTNNYEFEVMDVDGDGFLDMVTVNDGEIVDQKSWSRIEHIFRNDSAKRFIDATSQLWPASENNGEDDNNVVFLDFDSDGDPDFLLSSLTGEDRLLVNDGTGKFKLRQSILSGDPTPHTLSLVLGDINQDGKMDIIMGQGEGEEIIEERIFIGSSIQPDIATPKISHVKMEEVSPGTFTVKARIHDHKSPNMPQDWNSVDLLINDQEVPLNWYGENLWKATVLNKTKTDTWEICATDAAGNKTCMDLLPD
jgi:hypothetical protein